MFDSDEDIVEDIQVIEDVFSGSMVPRIQPDRLNPLEVFSSGEIKIQYRFSPDVIWYIIVPLVAPHIESLSDRGGPLPATLLALRYYASGDLQRSCAGLETVTQPTVSKVIRRVSGALCNHVHDYIAFPHDLDAVKQNFRAIKGFPSVIGCVDGTHVDIANPCVRQGETFRNRKGRFSINVQVIGGPDLLIYDLVCRWPGSAHDSRVFHNSNVKQRFENDELQGILLGDSRIPQLRYLFTPVQDPVMPVRPAINPADPNYLLELFNYREQLRTYRARSQYNRAHKSTRNSVERLIGNWKQRFLCNHRQSSLKLSTKLKVITATAVLYNLGVLVRDELQFDDELPDDQPPQIPFANNANGILIRDVFINHHFQ